MKQTYYPRAMDMPKRRQTLGQAQPTLPVDFRAMAGQALGQELSTIFANCTITLADKSEDEVRQIIHTTGCTRR